VPAPKDPALAEVDPLARALADTHSLSYRSFVNPEDLMTELASFNLPEVHALEVPAANGICTARGLARIYSVLATRGEGDGVHLLGGQVLEEAQREQAKGMDLVTHWPQCYSVGFMKPYGAHPYSIHPESFGHPGAGGSVAFSDPVSGLGFAYVMNRMGPYSRLDPRAESLIAALYASV
jgi:CubicO group peptidase (beta-lactamase class C family)